MCSILFLFEFFLLNRYLLVVEKKIVFLLRGNNGYFGRSWLRALSRIGVMSAS